MIEGRPVVGVLITYLDAQFEMPFCNALADYAREMDVNLIFYEGRSLKSSYPVDWPYHMVYQLANPEKLDALISFTGTIGCFKTCEELSDFFKPFMKKPLVSLFTPLEGATNLLVDNESGMTELMRHMVNDHGYREIGFIRGPEGHSEADARYRSYLKVMNEAGIEIQPDWVCNGDFNFRWGPKAIDHYLAPGKKRPKVLVFANDQMAFSAILEAQKRGLTIPGDLMIAGYDDEDFSAHIQPPLTTVGFSKSGMAKKALDLILEQLKGKKPEGTVLIPSHAISRISCGCPADLKERGDLWMKNSDFNSGDRPASVDLFSERLLEFFPVPASRKTQVGAQLADLTHTFLSALETEPAAEELFLNKLKAIVEWDFMDQHTAGAYQEVLRAYFALARHQQKPLADSDPSLELLLRAYDTTTSSLVGRFLFWSRDLHSYLWHLRQAMIQLNTVYDHESFRSMLKDILEGFQFRNFSLSLFDSHLERATSPDWKIPDECTMVAIATDNCQRFRHEIRFPCRSLIPDGMWPKERFTLLVNSLFNRNEFMGFVLFDLGHQPRFMFETLRDQIGNAFQTIQLFARRKEAEDQLRNAYTRLEKLNLELEKKTLTDELTGLFNRRGFKQFAGDFSLRSSLSGENVIVFMIDLDGLKKINDSFGHPEGDFAIRCAARILRETFRANDIVARLGGDEFGAIVNGSDQEVIPLIQKRLEKKLAQINHSIKQKPYQIGISAGYARLDPNHPKGLDEALHQADDMLYEIKRKKKEELKK